MIRECLADLEADGHDAKHDECGTTRVTVKSEGGQQEGGRTHTHLNHKPLCLEECRIKIHDWNKADHLSAERGSRPVGVRESDRSPDVGDQASEGEGAHRGASRLPDALPSLHVQHNSEADQPPKYTCPIPLVQHERIVLKKVLLSRVDGEGVTISCALGPRRRDTIER